MAAITSTRDPGVELRVQVPALAVDVHVDVRPKRRPLLAEAVVQAGPALLEARDGLADGGRVQLEVALESGEERRQGTRQVKLGHGYAT